MHFKISNSPAQLYTIQLNCHMIVTVFVTREITHYICVCIRVDIHLCSCECSCELLKYIHMSTTW